MQLHNRAYPMGHDIGVSASYYKPTERELLQDYLNAVDQLLQDYLNAVDLLTINSERIILQKQVAELNEKTRANDYIIRGKLEEKDEQLKNLSEKFNSMQSMLEKAITATTQVQNPQQFSPITQSLFASGVLKVRKN